MSIKANEAYNPFSRKRGIINKAETTNSASGSVQAIKEANGFKMGDSAICSLKTEYSISLLIPVYKKSMINSSEIISTIVDFDSLVKVNIRCNTFRFWIAGPSIVESLIMFDGSLFRIPGGKLVTDGSAHPSELSEQF